MSVGGMSRRTMKRRNPLTIATNEKKMMTTTTSHMRQQQQQQVPLFFVRRSEILLYLCFPSYPILQAHLKSLADDHHPPPPPPPPPPKKTIGLTRYGVVVVMPP